MVFLYFLKSVDLYVVRCDDCILINFLLGKNYSQKEEAVEQASQGGGGDTVSGDVQEM